MRHTWLYCRKTKRQFTGEIQSFTFDIKSTSFLLMVRIPPDVERQGIQDWTTTEEVGAISFARRLGAQGELAKL